MLMPRGLCTCRGRWG